MAVRRQKESVSKSHRGKNCAQKRETKPCRSQEGVAGGPCATPPEIGEYLIPCLTDYGIRDVFGIPGDFVLQFYAMLQESPIRATGTRREDCAGYAADGYARINGMGAVCPHVLQVGVLSVANSIAGAYAEKSPVIVISGALGIDDSPLYFLLHHRVRDFNTQREVFEKITVASALLDDPPTAFREIDRCFAAAHRFKRPVYLQPSSSRPRSQPGTLPAPGTSTEKPASDPDALKWPSMTRYA